jgi:hypothetical protein
MDQGFSSLTTQLCLRAVQTAASSMADEVPADDPWAAERSIACAGNKKENGTAEHAEHAENLMELLGLPRSPIVVMVRPIHCPMLPS